MPRLVLVLLLLVVSAAVAENKGFETPEATYQTYLAALKSGDYQQADRCYTHSSREFLQKNPEMTSQRTAQQLTRTYETLKDRPYTIEQVNAKRAIVRWQQGEDELPPLFMRKQKKGEGFRVDLMFMMNYIRHDDNGWSYTFSKAEKIWKSRE